MHDYVIFIRPQFVLHRVATAHGIEGDWFELYDDIWRDRRPDTRGGSRFVEPRRTDRGGARA